MTGVVDALVEEALRELSDEQVQATLWASSGKPEVSSLAEAKSRLWDDSGLAEAMSRGVVYSDQADTLLRQLRATLHRVDDRAPVEVVLASADLAEARSIAHEVLCAMREWGYDSVDP